MGRLMALKMAHLGGHLIIYDTDSDASGAPDEEIRQPTGHYACERRQPFPAAIDPPRTSCRASGPDMAYRTIRVVLGFERLRGSARLAAAR